MNLLDIVRGYDTITIFRHTSADPDALGSQFGLKYYLQNVFPEKNIYCLGEDVEGCGHMFEAIDVVDDEVIKNSVAIILDCANHQRVDDQRYASADLTIKIDHHPECDDYTDLKYVDKTAAATCQIITEMFREDEEHFDYKVAFNLYIGLQSDTMDFTTTNTTIRSFEAAQYLLSKGVNPNEVKELRSGISLDQYKMVNFIREKVTLDGNVGIVVLNTEDYQSRGLKFNEVKEKVSVLANVNEFKVWVLFTQDPETGTYAGSFRSKRSYIINDIAAKWDGGGHPNACGARGFTLETIKEIVKDFNDRINEVDNK